MIQWNYDASISSDIDSNDEWTFKNYTNIGSGADKTVIEFSDKYEVLLNFDGLPAVTNVSNFEMYNVTYYPTNGSIQEFGYFKHMTMANMSNI